MYSKKKTYLIALCAMIILQGNSAFAAELTDGMVNLSSSHPMSSYYDDVMDEAEDSFMEGDSKLACEALLCLSSGTRPHECNPALNRYFSIHKRKWKNTLKARRNFLRLCPTSNSTPQMESLVEVIVNGAGRCNASELNSSHLMLMPKKICREAYDSEAGEYYTSCIETEVQVVNPQLPPYCINYNDHGYTYEVGVHYVGDPLDGGHWVDDSAE